MRKIFSIMMLLAVVACVRTQPPAPVINYSDTDKHFIQRYQQLAVNAQVPVKIGTAYEIKDEYYFPMQNPSYAEEGIASWYGPGFEGNKTANGEIFNPNDFTAAHPSLPMPSIIEVTNLDNGKVINVRVNDRGPFHSKRILDVSKAAARELDMLQNGTANVSVRLLPRETLEYLEYARR
jgi:rare lipoprotein A